MKYLVLILLLCLQYGSAMARKKITVGQAAPAFVAYDVDGDTVSLEKYRGKKILLNFYRSVGCPVCNLYFHEVQGMADTLAMQNVIVVSVYESPAGPMKTYLQDEHFYSLMIPDSTEALYHAYKVQRNWWKMFKSNFTGTYGRNGKIRRGYALYRQRLKYDAHLNRIGADFLIDENGKIILAYYGRYFGDHVSLQAIRQHI